MKSQSNFVNALRQKDSLTENLAVTNSTSLNNCVDLFFMAGAARKLDDRSIISMFIAAYSEDPVTAMKILFWARDVRGGAGERRFFRVIWQYMGTALPELHAALIHLVPEYGRWDDLWKDSHNKPITFTDGQGVWEGMVMAMIQAGLEDDARKGMVAKWLPRKGPFARDVAAHLGLSPKEYRKLLVRVSSTVEQQMCANKWDRINYEAVPSVAMKNYRKAFNRHDPDRFTEYITMVTEGNAKINAGAIFPHDIIKGLLSYNKDKALVAQWDALPDYLDETSTPFLPMVDTSGSMYGLPIVVALALGLYMSERNRSIFKDAFLTFSAEPKLQYVSGDIYQRVHQMKAAGWGMNTDLESAYRLILRRAVEANLAPEDMPSAIIILSDMEFDECVVNSSRTLLEDMTISFKAAGYRRPDVIFWNIEGRSLNNKPATVNDHGVALVSGFSPSLLKSLLAGKIENPLRVMQRILGQERYDAVHEALR